MEENRVEGLWDCVYCGTVGIKARYDTCQNCGKPRGVDTMFYLPSDIKAATLTKEEAANTTNEPDWLCEYCDSFNKSTDNMCKKCGAERGSKPKNYGMLHKLTGKLFGRS